MTAPPSGGPAAAGPPEGDRARRFLTAVASWTPAGRGDWGRAMLAELDQVTGRLARWRFALGAARAALVPQRSRPLPWLAAIVLAAGAGVAGAALYLLAPGTGILTAALLSGLPAICAWAALATTPPARRLSGSARAVQVIAVTVIAACPVVALQAITRYPAGAAGPPTGGPPVLSVMLTADLTGALWLVLRLRAPLSAGRRSGLFGLAAALVLTGGLLLNQLLGVSGGAIWTAALAALLAAAVLAGRYDGGPVSALGAALWTVLIGGPAWFIVSTTAASRAMRLDARDPVTIAFAHSQGATNVLAWVAGNDLGGSIFVLTFASAGLGLLIIFGAVVARDIRRSTPLPAASPAAPQDT
jgi:hypothetical protein